MRQKFHQSESLRFNNFSLSVSVDNFDYPYWRDVGHYNNPADSATAPADSATTPADSATAPADSATAPAVMCNLCQREAPGWSNYSCNYTCLEQLIQQLRISDQSTTNYNQYNLVVGMCACKMTRK